MKMKLIQLLMLSMVVGMTGDLLGMKKGRSRSGSTARINIEENELVVLVRDTLASKKKSKAAGEFQNSDGSLLAGNPKKGTLAADYLLNLRSMLAPKLDKAIQERLIVLLPEAVKAQGENSAFGRALAYVLTKLQEKNAPASVATAQPLKETPTFADIPMERSEVFGPADASDDVQDQLVELKSFLTEVNGQVEALFERLDTLANKVTAKKR